MIITGVRLCGRHLQLRRLLICNCEKLSISARLMQRLHHWPHQLPAGSELIRLLLLMGQHRRRERKGAALSINVRAAPPHPSPRTRAAAGPAPLPQRRKKQGVRGDLGSAGQEMLRGWEREPPASPCPREPPVLTGSVRLCMLQQALPWAQVNVMAQPL